MLETKRFSGAVIVHPDDVCVTVTPSGRSSNGMGATVIESGASFTSVTSTVIDVDTDRPVGSALRMVTMADGAVSKSRRVLLRTARYVVLELPGTHWRSSN